MVGDLKEFVSLVMMRAKKFVPNIKGDIDMIPRSMPKRAIITEIECANFGKINGFSRLLMVLIMPFDLLS